MRAFVLISSVAALAVSACATPGDPGAPPPMADNGNDCAVIAAVAKEHYQFNTTDRLPPPLWLDGEGSGWSPRCNWSQYGLSFPRTFDPDARPAPGERIQWVSFKRPRYDGRGAVVESGIMHGPLAGMGVECRVISGFAGWTARDCRNTWIS
ncbi:MAG: hypothetical protein EON88_04035 [Brevundimonas sp.]|nr:MAG: hypothetical protein EON88_04035 [Brevundimonas sp.]